MRNKKLIEKFIKDHFDLTNFNMIWENDWCCHLIDDNNDKITISTFIPTEIWTMINDVKYLKYKFKECHCGNYWVVAND